MSVMGLIASRRYLPDSTTASWQTVFSASLNANMNNSQTYNTRNIIESSGLSGPATGTKIRITYEASSSQAWRVNTAYVGHQKVSAPDDEDFDGSQVELLFSAVSGFSISSGGTLLSDEITFAYDGSKDLVMAQYFLNISGNGARMNTSVANVSSVQNIGGSDQSATTDVSGYVINDVSADLVGVKLIEVLS